MRTFFKIINTILDMICESFFEGSTIAYPSVNDHVTLRSLERDLTPSH